jgi:hypothetical protein
MKKMPSACICGFFLERILTVARELMCCLEEGRRQRTEGFYETPAIKSGDSALEALIDSTRRTTLSNQIFPFFHA